MRILLAEDEKRMAAALVALLKQEKYDVDHLAEGTAMSADAIEIKISEDKGPGNDMQTPPDGNGQPPHGKEGQPPQSDGMGMSQDGPGQNPPDGEPPQKPDGEPPLRPDGGTEPNGKNPPAKPN